MYAAVSDALETWAGGAGISQDFDAFDFYEGIPSPSAAFVALMTQTGTISVRPLPPSLGSASGQAFNMQDKGFYISSNSSFDLSGALPGANALHPANGDHFDIKIDSPSLKRRVYYVKKANIHSGEYASEVIARPLCRTHRVFSYKIVWDDPSFAVIVGDSAYPQGSCQVRFLLDGEELDVNTQDYYPFAFDYDRFSSVERSTPPYSSGVGYYHTNWESEYGFMIDCDWDSVSAPGNLGENRMKTFLSRDIHVRAAPAGIPLRYFTSSDLSAPLYGKSFPYGSVAGGTVYYFAPNVCSAQPDYTFTFF